MARKPVAKVNEARNRFSDKVQNESNVLKIRLDNLRTFDPLTKNQIKMFELYDKDVPFLMLHGVAGTGKTFCAVYKALEQILDKSNSFHPLVIIRSAVQSRDIGHLPGDTDEKMNIFEQSYIQICETLFGRKDAWARLKEQGHVKFISTSFLRGCTFDNSIVLLDEFQNCTYAELSTCITRIGTDSKLIMSGDYRQTDLDKKKNDLSGIKEFMQVVKLMPTHYRIEFGVDDIVRGELVRDFILAEMQHNDAQC